MKRFCVALSSCILTVLCAAIHAQDSGSGRDGIEFFEKRIRPVLVDRCYSCHSAQAEKVKGGLLLDSRAGLLKGGDSGPAIVPGDSARSPLITAIRYTNADLRMPPKVRFRLTPSEVADFESWVKMGAPDPREDVRPSARIESKPGNSRQVWSFLPVVEPAVPAVKGKEWPRNAVDFFVLARLEELGLPPVADADKRTLIRRATFDLTGLPPKPEEIDEFLADGSPDAFAKVVDRLLASPHYGERWGRHWLDLVRYADTAGDNSDYPVPQAYRYRDYVIRSFNEDKPYDQFIREQIAGDLMPSRNDAEKYERIIATGFVAMARRFGTLVIDYNPHQIIEDTIDTLGRSVLGLTLGCARCHDHKFDPITQQDYYGLYGIFESTRYPFPGLEEVRIPKDFVPLQPQGQVDAILAPFREKLAPLEAAVTKLEAEKARLLKQAAEGGIAPGEAARQLKNMDGAINQAKKKRDDVAKDPPQVDYAYAVVDAARIADARMHVRGDPNNPGAQVPRRFLSLFGGQTLSADAPGSGRLELAGWLTDPSNPLMPRVAVNRIWQHHFGKGLVQTPSDFGIRGRPPTHPELLDFLARRFIAGGGSFKSMHRLILLSRTYQLSSGDAGANSRIDPNNDFLWRFSRRRLEAEAIRDAMLSVSGSLDCRMGGPHPFPPQKTWDFTQHKPFSAVYDTPRRTVYLMTQRFRRHPFLAIFDGADTNATTPQRSASVTAIQALYWMNDPFVREQARKFAGRLPRSPEGIEQAYLLAFGRPPTKDERRAGEEFLKHAGGDATTAWSHYAQALFSLNEFIYID